MQSGNVLFDSGGIRASELEAHIERALKTSLGYPITVVVRSRKQLKEIVEGAPPGFGKAAPDYRYDVLFLKKPLTAERALAEVPAKPGVDAVHAGHGVLYFSRRAALASQSRLGKVVMLPIYRSMTIRNWNTTTKLLALATA